MDAAEIMAMDGWYAGNAGAISGDYSIPVDFRDSHSTL
jgi:hypothetical protein